MKAEAWIFTYVTIFFLIMAPVYAVVTYFSDTGLEWTGTVALALTAGLGGMIAVYLWMKSGKIDPRPEDDKDGEIYQGAGEYGFFPPQSAWPFFCALVVGIMIIGPALGWWLTIVGAGIGIWAVAGWVYEYYRGDYAH
ncbi:MAG: cytochrome c oxidase subunit 4 [Propionibacterium sp.]|nr:cytochrome c oxidase subunit 4 [Propionibacterium sp.]